MPRVDSRRCWRPGWLAEGSSTSSTGPAYVVVLTERSFRQYEAKRVPLSRPFQSPVAMGLPVDRRTVRSEVEWGKASPTPRGQRQPHGRFEAAPVEAEQLGGWSAGDEAFTGYLLSLVLRLAAASLAPLFSLTMTTKHVGLISRLFRCPFEEFVDHAVAVMSFQQRRIHQAKALLGL